MERQRAVAERVLSGHAEVSLGWPDYPDLVTGLDRLAFGPLGNVAKLLADGLVRLGPTGRGILTDRLLG